MRRIIALFMFVVVALCAGLVATSSQVQAKGEGGGIPPASKEVRPNSEGTIIILYDGTMSFIGECRHQYDTKFFNIGLNIAIDSVVVSGDPVVENNMEGFILRGLPVPVGCFKDNATAVDVVVKSVKHFTPDPATGPRTSIIADVTAVRSFPKP